MKHILRLTSGQRHEVAAPIWELFIKNGYAEAKPDRPGKARYAVPSSRYNLYPDRDSLGGVIVMAKHSSSGPSIPSGWAQVERAWNYSPRKRGDIEDRTKLIQEEFLLGRK